MDTYPFDVSSVLLDLIPSPPAFIVMFPPVTTTESLPLNASPTEVTFILPSCITKSSLLTIALS